MRLATLLLACVLPLCVKADVIRIVGSDLLTPIVEAALQNTKAGDGQPLQIDLKGSLPGVDEWQSGNAMVLIEAIQPGRPVPHDAVPFGYAAVVVLVHKSNPILEMSLPQLASIYGQGMGAAAQRWNEVGVSGSFGNRAIGAAIVDNRHAILIDQFRDQVLSNQQLRSSVRRLANRAEVTPTFSGDVGAIVVTNRLPAEDGPAKALPLSLGGQHDFAFGPTEQNIHYGEYPLRVGFYIRFREQDRAQVKAIATQLLSDATATRLTEAGFIPAPASLRKRFLLELDK